MFKEIWLREYKSIMEEDFSCWFELLWQKNPAGMILWIHKYFTQKINRQILELKVEDLKKEFKFYECSWDFEKDIGFNGCFKRQGEKNGFIGFFIKETSESSELDAMMASFQVLSNALRYYPVQTSASFFQLMSFNTSVSQNLMDFGIHVEVSIFLRKWLKNLYEKNREVDRKKKLFEYRKFGLYLCPDGLFWVLSTLAPGYAAELNPDRYSNSEEGYEMHTQIMMGPFQQFIFLSLLAQLQTLVRKEIKKTEN